MRIFELSCIWLAVIGAAVAWVAFPVFALGHVPSWVANAYPLYICFPAAFLGTFAYFKSAGFARSVPLVLLVILTSASVLWTTPSELHNGILVAAALAESLPIAALINKNDYRKQAVLLFVLANAAAMALSFLDPLMEFHYGIIKHGGEELGNSASISIQCAIAFLFAFITWSERKAWTFRILVVAPAAALVLLGCLIGASRTAVLSILVALTVVLLMLLRQNARAVVLSVCSALTPIPVVLLLNQTGAGMSLSNVPAIVAFGDSFDEHLDGRQDIYTIAIERMNSGFNWLSGVGIGGVEKDLGEEAALGYRSPGPDGVVRAYAHSEYIHCVMALGLPGLGLWAWLLFDVSRRSFQVDRSQNSWSRTAFVGFLLAAGVGAVLSEEAYWSVIAGILWAMVSEHSPVAVPAQLPRIGSCAVWRGIAR